MHKMLSKKVSTERCKPASVPLVHNEKLLSKDDDKKPVDGRMFWSLVGGFMYLTATIP